MSSTMGDADNRSNHALTDFNKKVGILSTHEFTTTPYEIAEYISNDTIGEGTDIKNQMEHIFLENVEGYIGDTFNGILINNVGNTNGYLYTNLAREHDSTLKLYRNMTDQIHKSRLSLLEKEYAIHYNGFLSTIFQITTLVSVLVLLLIKATLDGYMKQVMSIIIIVSIIVIYLIFLAYVLHKNSKRYSDQWNKFYFSHNPSMKGRKKCK